jgi:type VI secretion system protein ImpA
MHIDLEMLLSEVSPEAPCGDDLSYDAAYLSLEESVRTKDAGGGILGTEEEQSEEPNWREVRENCLDLLQRSKNIRIAMYLTLSLLKLDGISGLSDGLCLLRGLMDRYWDHFYPQLDPDDNNDPIERANILQSLSPAGVSSQDPMKFKQRLSEVPLCHSAQIGAFSLRDIQIAKGEVSPGEDEMAKAPTLSLVDAAFQDTAIEDLTAVATATEQAIEHVNAIDTAFTEKAAAGQGPEFSGFLTVLADIRKAVQSYLAQRGFGDVEQESEGPADDAGSGGPSLSGEIRSSNDALAALEKICQYFERHEPSSPIPLLLHRAQRLVSKSFMEVVQDVCPEAISQVMMIGGISESDDD